jgi:signal peptidase
MQGFTLHGFSFNLILSPRGRGEAEKNAGAVIIVISLIVIGLLAAVYLVINLALPLVPINALVKTYLFQPLLWGLLILVTRRLPGYRSLAKQSLQSNLLQLALGIGFLQVFLYAIGGLFTGFGKNPSALTPLGIVENLLFVGLMLVGMEISRVRLVTALGKRHNFLALASTAVLFTFISIPLGQVTGFKPEIQSVNQVISSWAPLLAENLTASLLAMLAGARASLAYRALLAAFWWFCPILPDLNWSLKGLIGVGVPILGMIAVSSYYFTMSNRGKSRRKAQKASFPTGWVITALACVVIVWFAVGVFPFKPSVVPTGSMIPVVHPGDVVIVAKTPADRVRLGDIIEYRNPKENINIVHRVIEIEGEGSQRLFITRGDNNDAPDADPVPAQNVIGKVVFNVPRVGWLSIMVKNIMSPGKE